MFSWVSARRLILQSDVDKDKELSKFFKVNSVPWVIMIKPGGSAGEGEKLTNLKRQAIIEAVRAAEDFYSTQFERAKKLAYAEINGLLDLNPILLFARGSAGQSSSKDSEQLQGSL